MQYDIVIVGGGMVGSLLSCLLKNSQLSVAVIEPNKPDDTAFQVLLSDKTTMNDLTVNDFGARVSALTLLSVDLLKAAAAWTPIEKQRYCAYTGMKVWEHDGTAQVHFSSTDYGMDSLGVMVENQIVQQALEQKSKALAQNTWWHDKVAKVTRTKNGYQLVLANGQILQTKLLIGADGSRSFIREQLGFAVSQQSLKQVAMVCTVKTEKPHGKCARQIFHHTGPIAFLPLGTPANTANTAKASQHFCSIVWSCQTDSAQALLNASDAEFSQQLNAAFEDTLGAITAVSPRLSFPLMERHADYVKPHCVLLGDAAHTVHPLAGQGVNLGLWDAGVLAEEIITAVQAGDDWAGHATLMRYQRRRRWHNRLMQKSFTQLNAFYQTPILPLKLLRNIGVSIVNKNPILKRLFMEQATGKLGDRPDMGVFK